MARPGAGVYALTKFGVTAFCESLRQELISQRVRVSVVEPGTVDTELVTHNRVPIGVATLIAGLRLLPEVRAQKGSRLPDGLSAALLLAAVSLLVLAAVEAPAWGWAGTRTVGLLAAALVATGLTVLCTVRHPHALIEKALFTSGPFTFATIALFLFFVEFAVFLLNATLFLQDEWHYSALRAGLAIMPGPVTAAVFAVNAGRLARRFGRVWPAVTGAACMAIAAIIWLTLTTAQPSYVTEILPGMIVGGLSAGLTQAPLFAAAGTLSPDRATTGSAVLNMARQVGSAFGVAVVIVVIVGTGPRPR